jgi:Abortive infection C-terminus
MDSLKCLITRNLDQFPDFEYYIPIIEKAERNQEPHPDIAIECCLSLIQGISKTIILKLDKKAESDKLENDNNESRVHHQFKKAAELLKVNNDIYEAAFTGSCSGLTSALAKLRNARGDISHGRAVPRILQSDIELARLIMDITDSLLRYTLGSFFAIDLDKKAKELERIAQEEEDLIKYEDNQEFNDLLDEEYPLDGKLIYSEALYNLYYEDYEIQLQAYIDEKEEEEAQAGYEMQREEGLEAQADYEIQQEAELEAQALLAVKPCPNPNNN